MSTIKGIYKDGKILPEEKLSLRSGTKVLVEVFPLPEKSNAGAVRKALKEAAGSIPNLPDGVAYENRIRRGWRKRIKEIWGE